MELRYWTMMWATLVSCVALAMAIPASLVEEIKASELRENKVKRAHAPLNNNPEHSREVPYYNKPSAIKRGTNLKHPNTDQQQLSDWEQEQQQASYQTPSDSLANIQSTLYNTPDNPLFDDKTVAEYEKGFHYGTNKEKLDEALENAVLKSELYGDAAAINQYRYYGDDRRRRKRRNAKTIRMDSRSKRDVDLTPEEILTILSLYENERVQSADGYRPWGVDQDEASAIDEAAEDDENWMNAPVYPHASRQPNNDLGPSYMLEENKPYDKRSRWSSFAPGGSVDRNKRFMVAKKRNNDPTRELRYLNGPNKNDFYTLSQLLSNQREPNVPMYQRLIL